MELNQVKLELIKSTIQGLTANESLFSLDEICTKSVAVTDAIIAENLLTSGEIVTITESDLKTELLKSATQGLTANSNVLPLREICSRAKAIAEAIISKLK